MKPPPISRRMLGVFRGIVRGYFRRHFRGVRLSRAAYEELRGPLIVIGNHSSWWDPMVAFLLGERLFPETPQYAPMDASALEKYGILRKLGVFPVEMQTARGAVQFLRTGEAVLSAGGVLWVTPQGRFADVRERPVVFRPGVAALAVRVAAQSGQCTVLPLAIEYTFWDERLPECLMRLGRVVRVFAGETVEEVGERLRLALEGEMNALAELGRSRGPAGFELVLAGGSGTGGFYALGRRLRAFVLRRPYVADHTVHAQSAAVAEKTVRPELNA